MKLKLWISYAFIVVTTNAFSQSGKIEKLQKALDKAVAAGLVGISFYVDHPDLGSLTLNSGHADLANKIPMTSNRIFSLASVGKTYTATAMMLLAQENKIDLDGKIATYLPSEVIEGITNANQVSVRQLLNMTSGFYNYDRDPELNRLYLEGKLSLDTVSHLDILRKYAFNKPAVSQPGETVSYSSTNYVLLTMIMDRVLGYDHTEFINRKIIQPLGLKNTSYRTVDEARLTQHYGDLENDGRLEDITHMSVETTNWFKGDDGIYATAEESAIFMKSLLRGRIVNESSLGQMKQWVDKNYGLGLMYDKALPYKEVIGHTGRGIGSTIDVHYFPRQEITISILCNTGKRVGDRKFRKAYNKLRNRIALILFV